MSPHPAEGGTAYEIETGLAGAAPFAGPEGRDWRDFRVLAPEHAVYAWRTGADRVLAAADAYRAGRLTVDEALEDRVVERYLARVRASDPGLPEGELEDVAAHLLARLDWEALTAEGAPTCYAPDGDGVLAREAGAALPLPPWASLEAGAARGPGAAPATAIVLREGRSLADLARWLAARAADPVREAPRPSPPARGEAARRTFHGLFQRELGAPLPLSLPPGPLYYRPHLVTRERHPARLALLQNDRSRMNHYGEGFFFAGFWGHGPAPHAFYWCEVCDLGRVFLRLRYGGAHADRGEQRRAILAGLRGYRDLLAAARDGGWRVAALDWLADVELRVRLPNGRGLVATGADAAGVPEVLASARAIAARPPPPPPRAGDRYAWLDLGSRPFAVERVVGEGDAWARVVIRPGESLSRAWWEEEGARFLFALPDELP